MSLVTIEGDGNKRRSVACMRHVRDRSTMESVRENRSLLSVRPSVQPSVDVHEPRPSTIEAPGSHRTVNRIALLALLNPTKRFAFRRPAPRIRPWPPPSEPHSFPNFQQRQTPTTCRRLRISRRWPRKATRRCHATARRRHPHRRHRLPSTPFQDRSASSRPLPCRSPSAPRWEEESVTSPLGR